MEMATTVAPEAPPVEEKSVAKRATPEKMFKHSAWVHVGEGAAECPCVADDEKHQGLGCEDEEHFHAWCRLPNQFQNRDIIEKATAAKARRRRVLVDPDSDANEILEATLRSIRATEDASIVIEELLSYSWQDDYLEAMREVDEDERFKDIAQDREELQRLLQLPEDERGEEQLEQLESHIAAYVDLTQQKLKEVQQPRRAALEALSFDELINQLRDRRIEADADDAFQTVFTQWQWFAGTKEPNKKKDRWERLNDMTNEAPEVIDALQTTYGQLRMAMQVGGQGNS